MSDVNNNLRKSNKYITFDMLKFSELFRALKKDGWYIVRQRGSHVLMQRHKKKGQLTVPSHASKEVKKGLLNSILKQAGINPYPYSYEQKEHAAELQKKYAKLKAEEKTKDNAKIAGRLTAIRRMGKAS